ncbi:MAG: DNA primase [Actinomycetia bacterium]|nr:DNA primase [Actinomycetes bacterium]
MPYLSDEDITKVRESTDAVRLIGERVTLKQRGRQWWGCCPFHSEKTPSFKVDPASGLWHCFGCGEGGDVFGFVMRTEGLPFADAVRFLAERAHIELTVDPRSAARKAQTEVLRAICAETARFYNEQLLRTAGPEQDVARAYLGKRGFGTAVADRWQLGYAPGRQRLVEHLKAKGFKPGDLVLANVAVERNGICRDRFFERVMFPITDLQGRAVAFGGRMVEGLGSSSSGQKAKYLNSNDTPIFHKSEHLYGIFQARRAIIEQSCAVVVEGYTDVIALHEAGLNFAVATLGTALNARQVKLLSRFAKRIVYVFDGDEAGQRAADRAVEFIDAGVTPEFASDPLQLDVVVLPDQQDPAELVASADGRARMEALIKEAGSLFEFAIKRRLLRWDLERPEQRQSALRDAVGVIASLQGSLLGSEYAQLIADELAARGSAVELRQVLAELEDVAKRSRRQTSTPQMSEAQNLPEEHAGVRGVAAVLAEPCEPGVSGQQDLLALFLLSPEVRRACWSDFSPELFCEEAYRKVAEALYAMGPETEQQTIGNELLKNFPSLPILEAKYDSMVPEGSDLEPRTRVLIRQLHEAKLQSEIIKLRTQLRSSQDPNKVLDELVRREKELQELRAKRYN